MRTKRNKVYKKAMALYTTAFKFREPFQVLVDAEFVKAAARQKLNLSSRLEHILGGQVKMMITQCCITHLYKEGPESQKATDLAKTFERRKCNHWTAKDTDDECITGIIGDDNRYKYCVATQSHKLRTLLRKVPGVPLLFERRSVVLLEPPSDASVGKRKQIEESKLHVPTEELTALKMDKPVAGDANVQPASGVQANADLPVATRSTESTLPNTAEQLIAKNKRKRAKEPNPLSKKKKKVTKDGPGQASAGPNGEAKESKKGKKRARDDADSSKENDDAPAIAPEELEGLPRKAKVAKLHPDPTRGVPRPLGDGTSKKAQLRKKKKEQAAGSAPADAGKQEQSAVEAE